MERRIQPGAEPTEARLRDEVPQAKQTYSKYSPATSRRRARHIAFYVHDLTWLLLIVLLTLVATVLSFGAYALAAAFVVLALYYILWRAISPWIAVTRRSLTSGMKRVHRCA